MLRIIAAAFLLSVAAFGQIADIHVSAKSTNPFPRTGPVRGGRYEIKTASMVDLIRIAYGFPADKILGGPSWLEMDRFDVIAKVPPDSTPDTQKLILQSLLEDRFKLVVHKDTKPLPTYALTAGKTLHLKKAEGSEDPGCRAQSTNGPVSMTMMMPNGNGQPAELRIGPDMTIPFQCRNMTMAAFARGLRGMTGAGIYIGPNDVLDQTGLEGNWNFDIKWSMQSYPGGATPSEHITVGDAIDKQLGLKLEQRQVPVPVIVVDSVNRRPTENPPGVAEAFPVVPAPTEFEVADVKPTDPTVRGGRFQVQPGGHLNVQGLPIRVLVSRAFNSFNNDEIVGLPGWANTERFNINAKAPATSGQMDMESMAPLLRALLVDRFKMTYHTEDRQVSAYSLVSVKPKMKKADSATRSSCKADYSALGETLNCHNITMAGFVEQLWNTGPGMSWTVLDATGIEGGWDFTLTFDPNAAFRMNRPVEAPAANGVPMASDPSGTITVFEAVEKQLGLKLEMRKRSMPVIVIDHIEQKPTDN
jgi:uncharacterized protein (TIGR03435 family)